MSWAVDPPVRLGALSFAAITETKVHTGPAGRSIMGVCSKRPLLILVARARDATGLDLKGNRLSAAEVDAIYPKAIETFLERLDAGGD